MVGIEHITAQTLHDILKGYDVQFLTNMDGKGCIAYDTKQIFINPVYEAEKKETLAYCLMGHIMQTMVQLDVSEKELEQYADRLLENKQNQAYLDVFSVGKKYLNCAYDQIPQRRLGKK